MTEEALSVGKQQQSDHGLGEWNTEDVTERATLVNRYLRAKEVEVMSDTQQ